MVAVSEEYIDISAQAFWYPVMVSPSSSVDLGFMMSLRISNNWCSYLAFFAAGG